MSDHAQRLREIAERRKFASQEFRLGWIEEGFHPQNPQLTSRIEKDATEIAALLAGAAALEREETAKGYLRQIASGQSWSPSRDAAEALERLEAMHD